MSYCEIAFALSLSRSCARARSPSRFSLSLSLLSLYYIMSCCAISMNDMQVCCNMATLLTSMCFVSLEYGMLMRLSPSRLSPLASRSINGHQRPSTAINGYQPHYEPRYLGLTACAHIPTVCAHIRSACACIPTYLGMCTHTCHITNRITK
jgi:hypothetical protein